jgi:hypothetical protein
MQEPTRYLVTGSQQISLISRIVNEEKVERETPPPFYYKWRILLEKLQEIYFLR